MDSTFRANEVFIPVVFLEAGASETLVCSRAKRAQSELEALIAPRRVEGSQRNFLDSLPTPYSVNHLTEKTRLCSRKKTKTKGNESNAIDPEGIRHGMSPVAGWAGGQKKRWGKRQRMCVRGVDERPPNHPLQVASLSLSLVTHIPLRVGAKAHCLGGCLKILVSSQADSTKQSTKWH